MYVTTFIFAWNVLRTRLAVEKDESGYTTETIIITAMLAALALLAVGLIVTNVTGTANRITTDGPGTPGAGG